MALLILLFLTYDEIQFVTNILKVQSLKWSACMVLNKQNGTFPSPLFTSITCHHHSKSEYNYTSAA